MFHLKILQGGILWLQNLTEYPHGVLGPIFPLCIAGLHLANVQVRDNTSNALLSTSYVNDLWCYWDRYLVCKTIYRHVLAFHTGFIIV